LDLMPDCEHRKCARHIFANWRRQHKGEDLQRQFWKCAKANTIADLEIEVSNMEKLNLKAKEDMMKVSPTGWSRAYQLTHCKSDVVVSNMCETFNGIILEARSLAIFGMLEWIRKMVMKRIAARKKFAQSRFKGELGPRIWEKIEAHKEASANFQVDWNGSEGYEVFNISNIEDTYVVNMQKRRCTCRVWDLTGLPCPHALCVIYFNKSRIEDYVAHWYKKETFEKSYQYSIHPVVGEKYWPQSTMPPPLPPMIRKMSGKPKKNRIKEDWEEL
jgi:hypothetical protein